MKEGIYFVISAVIFIIAGVSPVSSDCSRLYEDCEFLILQSPETFEEVEPFCWKQFHFFNCYRNNVVTCGSNPGTLKFIDRLKNYYKDFCNNTSPLQQAYINNVVCIRTTVQDEKYKKCNSFEIEEDTVIKGKEALQQNGIPEVTLHENFTAKCMSSLYAYTCAFETMREKCGEAAAYALSEMYKSMFYDYTSCNEEVLNYLPQIIELLKESVNELTEEPETEDFERLLAEENFAFKDMAF